MSFESVVASIQRRPRSGTSLLKRALRASSFTSEPSQKQGLGSDFGRQVREVEDSVLDYKEWHVVRSDAVLPTEAAACNKSLLMSSLASEVQVQSDVAVVIVPVDMHSWDLARDLLASVQVVLSETTQSLPRSSAGTLEAEADMSSEAPQRPVVIALLVSTVSPPSAEISLQAQQMMLEAGADDVVLKSGTKQELSIALALAAARVQDCRRRAARGMNRHRTLISELRAQLELEAQRLQVVEEHEDPPQGMFWQVIQDVFQGFPSMNRSLPANTRVGTQLGKFKLMQALGCGTSGRVFAAVNSQTQEVEAIKTVEKNNLVDVESVRNLWREMRCLIALKHNNITRFLGAMHGPTCICIRMEYAGANSLFRAQKLAGGSFSPKVARSLQLQLVSAIAYCHGQGVAHRDLKPENMGLDDSQTLKLLDFGSAKSTAKPCTEIAGTMPFMAPEVLESSSSSPYYPASCDVWSCGVILLEMLCGIDKMNRMMGWSRDLPPCPRRAEEIRAFFMDRRALLSSLAHELGMVEDSLHTFMVSMLQPWLERRLKAVEVLGSGWLQTNPAEREAGLPGSPDGPSED